MGTDPTESVVDAECRVHGIDGLRVVDASVMPSHRQRQHQRADHHDRGESERPDPRAIPAAARIAARVDAPGLGHRPALKEE